MLLVLFDVVSSLLFFDIFFVDETLFDYVLLG